LNRARSVFVLHGFPSADYRVGSFFVVWLVTLIAARLARLVISNSIFTQTVNSRIFRIDSDAVWNPLRCGQVALGFPNLSLRPRRVAFVGRAVPGKNVFEAASAFLRSERLRGWTMQVIGPVEDGNLARLASCDPRIQLLGRLSHDDVLKELSEVRVMISLNPIEPYGFVYQEAAACGAVVVAPFLAGATEELRVSYSARLVQLHELNLTTIQEALERAAHRTEEAPLVA
jgi:glycosyltransferase involved in cell wall biosynthesis